MGSERISKRTPSTPKLNQRRRLSNITNLPRLSITTEDSLPSCMKEKKHNEIQFEKEIAALKKELADREETVLLQCERIEKLKLTIQQKSAQNEEIIQHYLRQYKELTQSRDELRLLRHEYTQMTTTYRIRESEFQLKLAEVNELLRQEREKQTFMQSSKNTQASTQFRQVRARARRRYSTCSLSSDDLESCSTKLLDRTDEDDASTATTRPTIENSTSIRIQEGCEAESPKKKYNSRYRHLQCADPTQDLFEEEELGITPASNSALDDAKPGSKAETISTVANTKASEGKGNMPKKEPKEKQTYKRFTATIAAEIPSLSNRSQSGRPVRRAAGCVTSYKEPPLNTKMRRSC